ncbi:MAG: MFS transporter [Anaerolineae bacterium]
MKTVRTFYILILTQTFSLIGSRISSLALGMWLFNETGQATPLALVAFFTTIPAVVASGLSGVLADRWDRRLVMVLSDAGQALGTALLLISFLSGSFEVWHLYVVTLIQAVFGVFQGPAFQASMTMLIPDNQRDRANAIMQLTGPMAGIVAPIFAGFIFAAVGVEGAIMIDLLTFLAAMVVVFNVTIPRPTETAEGAAMRGTVWEESWSGLRYLRARPSMFFMTLYIALINFVIAGTMTLSIPYLLARTGSEATLGLILGLFNLGAIVGGVVIGIWGGTRPRMFTILPGLIFAGIMMMGMGSGRTPVMLAVSFFLFMLPLPMINALAMSIMQAKVPPDLQGRVFAVLGQMSLLLTPLSYLIVGPLADRVFEPAVGQAGWAAVAPLVGSGTGAGIGLMFFGAGVLVVLMTTAVLLIPLIRDMERLLPDYQAVAEANAPQGAAPELGSAPVA